MRASRSSTSLSARLGSRRSSTHLYKGLSSLVKGRKIITFAGTGALGAGHLVRVTGNDGTATELHGRHVVLASGSVPRTIPGFDIDGQVVLTSDEVLDARQAAVVRSRDRRGSDRVRVRVDDGGPWRAGDDPRGPAEDPSGM